MNFCTFLFLSLNFLGCPSTGKKWINKFRLHFEGEIIQETSIFASQNRRVELSIFAFYAYVGTFVILLAQYSHIGCWTRAIGVYNDSMKP